jgi:hypothetical protein
MSGFWSVTEYMSQDLWGWCDFEDEHDDYAGDYGKWWPASQWGLFGMAES